MQKGLVALAITALIAASLLAERPVHIDPRSLPEIPLPQPSLLLYYAELLGELREGNYEEARELLGLLAEAGGPPFFKSAADRANRAAELLTDYLSEAQERIELGEELLYAGEYDRALEEGIEAERLLREANSTLEELERGLREVSSRLGAPLAMLMPSLGQLEDRLGELEARLDRLLRAVRERGRVRTFVSVGVEPQVVEFGSSVEIEGRLVDEEGKGVENATLEVSVGRYRTRVSTGEGGAYRVEAPVAEYREAVPVVVSFDPGAESIYARASNRTEVYVKFVETIASISVQPVAHPGLPLGFNVTIRPAVGIEREFEVSIDGERVLGAKTSEPTASLEVLIPPSARPGVHVLEVSVRARGEFSPASARATFVVSLIPISAEVSAPALLLLPLYAPSVSGAVYSPEGVPLANAKVVLLRGGEVAATSRTDSDGRFSLEIPLAGLLPLETSEYKVVVEPVEPYYGTYSYSTRVVEVNLLSLAAIVAALALLARLRVAERVAKRIERGISGMRTVVIEGLAEEGVPLVSRLESAVSPRVRALERGIKRLEYIGGGGALYEVYVSILFRLSVLLGSIRKSETFREYMYRIASRLPEGLARSVLILTLHAEAERYGKKSVGRREVLELAEEVLDELER